MSAGRLDTGGVIDRSRPLKFRFDGRDYEGFDGDTLASALVANNVRILGRSFKYHRPRGLWGAWVDDPNAIMNVRLGGFEAPNCLAATTYLEEGMEARSVNAWPSASRDIKGALDLFQRWLGAGFYYKTFMWPDWHLFEPSIRKMAGLGKVSPDMPSDYEADQVFATCDVLVVGGGVAGLKAAQVAAQSGAKVCLVDDQRVLGGSAYQLDQVDGEAAVDWVAAAQAAILAAGGQILKETTATGVYDHKLVSLVQNRGFGSAPRLIRMRTKRIILASGALDRPMTFPENDRPGIMALGTGTELLARYAVRVGRTAAIVATHTAASSAANQLSRAGITLTMVDATQGEVRGFGGRAATGLLQGQTRRIYDAVLTSGGYTPLVHLWRHAGGKLDWCAQRQAFLPGTPPEGMQAVGAANGTFDLDQVLVEAETVGRGEVWARAETAYTVTPAWPKPSSTGRQWIDFQHDVTLKDVEVAARENYVSVEHLKRYTTLGMASDQGKTSNMAGLAAMAQIQGRPMPEVGTTTFRPPYVPVPMELYRGHHRQQHWHPVKRLPLEETYRALGAVMGEYGGWLRPGWYGDGLARACVATEVQTARNGAGLFDGSPLGKIEVMGPDAEDFMNFVYYNTIKTLKAGRLRYGFMLTEGGIVYDDGVVARLGPHHFIVSCSSSHVDGVRTHLEAWRQDGNDPERIFVHDTTMHWATLTVTGPKAREVVVALGTDLDLAPDAFPHMSFQNTLWRETPLRIARVSFSGDLSYEISIRATKAVALWDALVDAGGVPIGIEAMSVMRAEKGFIIIGKDTDGETMPHDLGFGLPRTKKTAAFIGDRSLHTDKACAQGRKQLVGLSSLSGLLPTGAHIVKDGSSQGYVTSSYHSPTLENPIALGLVADGLDRMGEVVTIQHLGKTQQAQVCPACFFDPTGERLNA